MVPYRQLNKCKCEGTCNCSITGSTTSTDTYGLGYYGGVSESDKRAVEEKQIQLEKKEELKQVQHWKHKNKPRF